MNSKHTPLHRARHSFCIPHSVLCIVHCALCILVAAVSAAATNSPYGVVAHLQRDEFIQRDGILRLMNVAGISNVRFDIDWTSWEKDHALPRVAAVLDAAER